MLKIANNLTLPRDVVTQTIAMLAKRRAGKSYTMRRLAEQLVEAGQQIVIVDPKGDQWGIRSAADGKGPGLPVVILGGERADVPLEVGSGEVVAKLVVEERVSALLDLSLFRKHEVATFMTGFLESLYRLKAREIYRTPMMLIIDEADAIAPQKPQKGEERMLGAAEDIVRRGGQRGIGCTLVTQRSAVLNKNVLTQAQVLVALRTIAPQDLNAMKAWIDVHGSEEQQRTLMESLPSLPVGDAWFWSPGWPTTDGIFKLVHILPIETFDSGATPKPGEKRREPKTVADVDLEALKRQMSATIEKAKADDPRELRKQIATLKTELTQKNKVLDTVDVKTKRIEQKLGHIDPKLLKQAESKLVRAKRIAEEAMKLVVTVKAQNFESKDGIDPAALTKAVTAAVAQVTAALEKRIGAHVGKIEGLKRDAARLEKIVTTLLDETVDVAITVQKQDPFVVKAAADRPARPARVVTSTGEGDGSISPARQKILNGLAFLHGIGVTSADKTRLALIVGVSPTSGGYFNNLGALRSSGLIDYPTGGTVALTDAGAAAASTDGVPSTTDELHEAIRTKLPPAKWRILERLIAAYPRAISKDDLAAKIDVSPTSGGYFNNLGSLRSLGLLDYPQPGTVAALPVLFLEER